MRGKRKAIRTRPQSFKASSASLHLRLLHDTHKQTISINPVLGPVLLALLRFAHRDGWEIHRLPLNEVVNPRCLEPRSVGLVCDAEPVPETVAEPEPDLSAESTPTGEGCQMKQASIFTENLPKLCQIFTKFHSTPQISDTFEKFYDSW